MPAKATEVNSRVLPFLPDTLAQWYRDHTGQTHRSTRHHGALVCLDASGFTALTGELEARGQDGPEVLTQILNAFFASIIGVAQKYGGDILKFSGDGLWLFFPDPRFVPSLAEAMQGSLRELNERHPYLKTHPLGLHIGAEAGSFELISFGDARYRLEAEPVGQVVATAYSCCDEAEPGQLVMGPEMKRLGSYESLINMISPRAVATARGSSSDSLLWHYMPQTLVSRLADGDGCSRLESEYRDVTVLFCQCRWPLREFGEEPDSPIVLAGKVLESIRACGGSLARIDPFKDGHKFLTLFGAPVTRSDDQWRALECSRQLVALNSEAFQVRVGLAHGRTFCGAVGSPSRMEYTIMGSAANLAARLMGKADWGTVLFDDAMRELLPSAVVSTVLPMQVKGFAEAITVNRLDRLDDQGLTSFSISSAEEFRHPSYRAVLERWVQSIQSGSPRFIFVHGEHGTGKSLVLGACLKTVDGRRRIALDAKQSIFFGPGHLARKLLSALATLHPTASVVGLDQWVGGQFSGETLSALAGVLQVVSEDEAWTKDLTPQLRSSMANRLFTDIVGSLLVHDVVVVVDDLDKADALSRQLILALLETPTDLPMTILAAVTEILPVDLPSAAHATETTVLRSPTKEEWQEYLVPRFSDGRREEELVARLLEQSDCLPGTVFGFLADRLAAGDLKPNRVTDKWELSGATATISIPRSARDLHLEKFDSLPEDLRTILKTCAISPTEFNSEMIAAVGGERSSAWVDNSLSNPGLMGIVEMPESKHVYRFTSQSMRDAIYGCIPHAVRTVWHTRAAQWLEQQDPTRTALLAYHYASAQQVVKGFAYSLKAAGDALSLYALADAALHFGSCKELIGLDDNAQIAKSQLLEYYQQFARFLILEGRPQEAYRIYRKWRRTALDVTEAASALTAALGTAELLWQQSQYGRCTRVVQAAIGCVPQHQLSGLVARGMTLMAEVARRTGRFAEAESWARKALEVSSEPSAMADAYNRLGLAIWGQGRLPEAVDCLQQSLASGQEAYSMYNRARVANNLAIVHWQMGALVQAEPLMREAIDIFRRQGDRRNEAYARGNLAALVRAFGRYGEARGMLAEADIIFERLNDRHAHYYTVGNLGDIDLVSGDLESARRRFDEALAFADSIGDGELQAECKVRLAEGAFFSGDIQGAELSLNEAIALAEKIGSGEFALRSRVALARIKVGQRDLQSLDVLTERIRKDAQASRTAITDREGQFLQGERCRLEGDRKAALKHYEDVLVYAREQNLFELSLKCIARIIEHSDCNRPVEAALLEELARKYEFDNGRGSWQTLLESKYFTFFHHTLDQANIQSQTNSQPNR